ncbi:MAG: TIGR03960 family B12-binding radical SAM protein [Bacteroidales bacterium]|nr:TIGR03960 family B12-binding radical SAM protein [Clostridium sp.]MCM1204692.1 TIGR03960 family B12-binding radical SAM protein [Bacteroidales bacterium]
MSKLALSDEILMEIEKPARYIGNEVNMVKKKPEDVDIRFCMCFPDVYEIGMSHLGIQIIYDVINRREDAYCERVYSPWPDLDRIMREKQIPLFSLETQTPVKQFDFLGITLQYEMCYTNILQILELSGIPVWAKDRTWEDPIVFGGGPCSYNPEPIADFFDVFYIGEGETRYHDIFTLYQELKKQGVSREEMLYRIAGIPGMYVPSMYEVSYHEDGTISSFKPKREGVPATVAKEIVLDFDKAPYPSKPLVPYIKATQDRVTLEIMRGCIRGCRFCQAGMIYRPTRQKNVETLKQYAREMIKSTGHEEISLSSLSSSDYECLKELIYFLIDEIGNHDVNISLPSLRIDAFSLDVMKKVQDIRKSSLTFAPEAGTQRLRDVINKGLTEEVILNGAMQAFKGGWNKVKFYFMLGLPTETDEDAEGIPKLCETVAEAYYSIPKEERNGKVSITASASFFVPKPFTPFQWAPMMAPDDYKNRAHQVKDTFRKQLNSKSMKFTYHESDVSALEGVFARGDRKLSRVIYDAYKSGCIFDSWTEFFDNEKWMAAFAKNGVSIPFYTTRARDVNEILPWDFIDIGVTKRFLASEWEKAKQGIITPNCREKCSGCGAAKFGGGVCIEGKN